MLLRRSGAIWSLRRDGYGVMDLERHQRASKGGTRARKGIRHTSRPPISLNRLEGILEAPMAEPWMLAHYREEYGEEVA